MAPAMTNPESTSSKEQRAKAWNDGAFPASGGAVLIEGIDWREYMRSVEDGNTAPTMDQLRDICRLAREAIETTPNRAGSVLCGNEDVGSVVILRKIQFALTKESLTDHERVADARAVVCAAISAAERSTAIPQTASNEAMVALAGEIEKLKNAFEWNAFCQSNRKRISEAIRLVALSSPTKLETARGDSTGLSSSDRGM